MSAGAAQMGAKVALIEAHKMGGDCLNYGCVPSKALIAAAHRAQQIRTSSIFGVQEMEPKVDMSKVKEHIQHVIGEIAPNDSIERFTGLGVHVYEGHGSIVDKHTVSVGDEIINARYIVIATGSRPLVPPIPGLDDIPYFTNETIFDNEKSVDHLLVIGGGPIGSEIAQSYRRLGAKVSIIDRTTLLSKNDPEAAAVVKAQFLKENIDLHERAKVVKLDKTKDQIRLHIEKDGQASHIAGSHLLIAVGRTPNTQKIGLENVGIAADGQGLIKTDERLRTSVKNIFAIGDVTGPYLFTHMAGYQAGIVIRNMLFKIPAKAKYTQVPWVTYTAPELAHVGLSEQEAKEKLADDFHILRWPLHENDRAVAERTTDGFVKVITNRKGKILGATIVGKGAGDLLAPWNVAVARQLPISAIANTIMPYPTFSEAGKRAAGSYYTPKIFSDRVRKIVRLLLKI